MLKVIVGGQPQIDRSYPGFRITCIQCRSLLNGATQILGLDVLNGGYGCNFILAQVGLNTLLGQCAVYGVRGTPIDCVRDTK